MRSLTPVIARRVLLGGLCAVLIPRRIDLAGALVASGVVSLELTPSAGGVLSAGFTLDGVHQSAIVDTGSPYLAVAARAQPGGNRQSGLPPTAEVYGQVEEVLALALTLTLTLTLALILTPTLTQPTRWRAPSTG